MAISSLVAQWEREQGIELSDADFNGVATQVDLYGLTPDEAFANTDQGRAEADFDDLVTRIETDLSRTLTESELGPLWKANEQAELRGEDHVDTAEALLDLDNSTDRAEYIGQRLAVPQERDQPSAVQVDEDGDEIPSFNVESRDERSAAIDAALSGEAVATHDSTFETTTGDDR